MEYKRELHPLLETLGLIYLVKNFSSVRAECVQSLKEMEIDGEAFYKKNLSYLEKYVNEFEKEELKEYFPEFAGYEGTCRFHGCSHIHEPGCAVKAAVDEGKIHSIRYQDYVEMYEELKNRRRY